MFYNAVISSFPQALTMTVITVISWCVKFAFAVLLLHLTGDW